MTTTVNNCMSFLKELWDIICLNHKVFLRALFKNIRYLFFINNVFFFSYFIVWILDIVKYKVFFTLLFFVLLYLNFKNQDYFFLNKKFKFPIMIIISVMHLTVWLTVLTLVFLLLYLFLGFYFFYKLIPFFSPNWVWWWNHVSVLFFCILLFFCFNVIFIITEYLMLVCIFFLKSFLDKIKWAEEI